MPTAADLADASLVLARELSDAGGRTGLNDVIAEFGTSRDEPEAELAADLECEGAIDPGVSSA